MSGIKVHGSPLSTATMRVLATLYELELEYELVPVDTKNGEHKKEPYLSLNPFGQLPALEDGDLKLFESRAITQYLATEYQDKGAKLLCPGSNKATIAGLRVSIEVEGQQFDPVASKLAFEQFYKPLFGMTTDPAAVEQLEEKLEKVLDVYEARLGQSKYIACDCFTLADLHHMPVIHFLLTTPSKKLFDARPKVSAWIADITARPAWAKVLALQKQ